MSNEDTQLFRLRIDMHLDLTLFGFLWPLKQPNEILHFYRFPYKDENIVPHILINIYDVLDFVH